jgi:hypothetical protein
MSEPPKSGEEALEPVYPISGPNMDIPLWNGEFEYYTPNVFRTKGRVNARLLPNPSTCIEFESVSRYGKYLDEELRLGPIGTTKSKDRVMLHLTSFHSDEDGTGIHCEGELTRDILTEQIECDKVIFHIPNFLDYFGEPIHSTSPGYPDNYTIYNRRGRQRLTDGTWEIILDNVFNCSDIIKQIEAHAGFGITHVGMLHLLDGGTFRASEAEKILNMLYWFLSFARGSRCGPMLFVGSLYEKNTWEPWNTPALHSWKRGTHGWIEKGSTKTTAAMKEAFQGFDRRWTDDYWRPCLQQAIHWYAEANRGAGGVEGSIALIQLALELICWACLEESSPNKATVEAFEKKGADEKIRDTLKILQIPSNIDNSTIVKQYLDKNITDGTLKDGPRAISYLRNAIIHPMKKKRDKIYEADNEVKWAVKCIGLNYIALALLKIVDYNGVYLNHISWGEEQVPWAASTP